MKADTEVVVELGQTYIDTQQFLTLKAGDVIPLDRGVHEPLQVKIQKIPKAKVLPGTLNGHRAVKFTSLIAREED